MVRCPVSRLLGGVLRVFCHCLSKEKCEAVTRPWSEPFKLRRRPCKSNQIRLKLLNGHTRGRGEMCGVAAILFGALLPVPTRVANLCRDHLASCQYLRLIETYVRVVGSCSVTIASALSCGCSTACFCFLAVVPLLFSLFVTLFGCLPAGVCVCVWCAERNKQG